MDKKILLERIETLCQERKITLNTAFTESKVGKNFKSNLNYAEPTLGKVRLLADYFRVSVEYLLGESGERKEKSPAGAELEEKDRLLIEAYHRAEPVIQSTIDKLLGIDERETVTLKIAARGGSGNVEEREITKEQWEKIKKATDLKGV